MFGKGLTMADLASRLATQFGHPVIDKTGLADRYDFVLEYTLDLTRVPLPRPPGADIGPPPTSSGDSAPLPDVEVSVEKQLGLKLSRAKAELDVIVRSRGEGPNGELKRNRHARGFERPLTTFLLASRFRHAP
jgi:uncharacterized protein (TIGR03435 family)